MTMPLCCGPDPSPRSARSSAPTRRAGGSRSTRPIEPSPLLDRPPPDDAIAPAAALRVAHRAPAGSGRPDSALRLVRGGVVRSGQLAADLVLLGPERARDGAGADRGAVESD